MAKGGVGWEREGLDGGGSPRMNEGRLGWGRHGLFGGGSLGRERAG
jgi:hypothetical protein